MLEAYRFYVFSIAICHNLSGFRRLTTDIIRLAGNEQDWKNNHRKRKICWLLSTTGVESCVRRYEWIRKIKACVTAIYRRPNTSRTKLHISNKIVETWNRELPNANPPHPRFAAFVLDRLIDNVEDLLGHHCRQEKGVVVQFVNEQNRIVQYHHQPSPAFVSPFVFVVIAYTLPSSPSPLIFSVASVHHALYPSQSLSPLREDIFHE